MYMLAYHFHRCVSVPLTAVLMAQDYAWHSAGSQWLLFRRNAVFLLYKKSGQNRNILDKSAPPPQKHTKSLLLKFDKALELILFNPFIFLCSNWGPRGTSK